MALYIKDQSCYIPENSYDVVTDGESFGLDSKKITVYSRFYGLKKVPYEKDLTIAQMAIKAITPLINKPSEIDFIVHAHTAPVVTCFSESIVRNVRNHFNLMRADYFATTMQKCVSSIKAIEMMNELFDEEQEQNAIIFAAEKYFTPEYRVMTNISITADAASGILVSNKTGHSKLVSLFTTVFGQYAKGIWLDASELSEFGSHFIMYMGDSIDVALERAGIGKKDLKLVLPHNVNIACWKNFSSYYQYPLNQIYLKNVSRCAHCYNSDLFINLDSVLSEKRLQRGDYYLMATLAVNAVFGVAVFQYLGGSYD